MTVVPSEHSYELEVSEGNHFLAEGGRIRIEADNDAHALTRMQDLVGYNKGAPLTIAEFKEGKGVRLMCGEKQLFPPC